jgi:hypothetical protein
MGNIKPLGTGKNGQLLTTLTTDLDILFSNINSAPSGEHDCAFSFIRGVTGAPSCHFDVSVDDQGNFLTLELDAAKAQVYDNGDKSIRINARAIAVDSSVPTDFAVGDAISITVQPTVTAYNFVLRNVFKLKFLYGTASNLNITRSNWA